MIVNYRNDSKSAQSIVKQIESFGGKAIAVKADVFTKEGIDKLFDAVKNTFSKIDVLVNNAASFDNNDSPTNISAFQNVDKIAYLWKDAEAVAESAGTPGNI